MHTGDADALWRAIATALGVAAERDRVEARGLTGAVERLGERHAIVRLEAPVPGMPVVGARPFDEGTVYVNLRAHLFGPGAAAYAQDEQSGWQAWGEGLTVPAA